MTQLTKLSAVIFCLITAGIAHSANRTTSQEDVRWLNRVTYGINSTTLARYQALGRADFLKEQLQVHDDRLPLTAQQSIDALTISHTNAQQLLADAEAENRRINALSEGDEKIHARQAFQEAQDRVAYEAAKRHLLRALYSPAQLKEQMVWFWLNHFNVFRYKGNIRWLVADYEESAIRPYALGNFRDLLRATVKHPAMLLYLDGAQSSVNKINENYARELLELHTMGVNGGYTQQDVQELARILTGVTVNPLPGGPKVKSEWQSLVVRDGAFEFNPARHDFGDKMLLGHRIVGRGYAEVEEALDLIVSQQATANFICKQLAIAFVADDPPPELVSRMAKIFQQTHSDIASVLNVMFTSKEFQSSLASKFKDPMHYVVSALRLAYDAPTRPDRVFSNLKPVNNMLNSLGEGLYGHLTPDGYGLRESDWASAGQMSKRFEIAKGIGISNGGLFDTEDGSPTKETGFPQLNTQLYYSVLEMGLSEPTRTALSRASAQWEWNTSLLSSPDFMYH